MKLIKLFKRTAITFGVMGFGLAFATSVFAAKDVIYPSAVNNLEVDNSPASFGSTSFTEGANGNATLAAAVAPGALVSLEATWSIKDNSDNPPHANYPRTVNFTSPADVTINPSSCTVTSVSSTCTITISFTAPAINGNYTWKIDSKDSAGGATNIDGKRLNINFSVADSAGITPVDTVLTVDQHCFILNAGNVEMTATLKELDSSGGDGDPIPGATILFYINPIFDGNNNLISGYIGEAYTDSYGVVTLLHNIDSLGVGDHTLYAEFEGLPYYNPSNDSANLGISYLFVGFQPPINAAGNSIFGNGRVIPIKIKITDADLNPVYDAAPTVWLTTFSSSTGLGTEFEETSSVSSADTDNIMRYVPADGHYIYNWDLSSLTNGTYAVVVDLGDSPTCSNGPYYVKITVDKRGNKK
jgi:hypothetical protein